MGDAKKVYNVWMNYCRLMSDSTRRFQRSADVSAREHGILWVLIWGAIEKHLLTYNVHMQSIDIHWRFFLWVGTFIDDE